MASCADQESLPHDEPQPAEFHRRFGEFAAQVGQHAGKLVVSEIGTHMLVRSEQDLAGSRGDRRVPLDPHAAAGIGEGRVNPHPAAARRERGVDLGSRDELRRSVLREAVSPQDGGGRR
jgi:hypothetical protein